MGRRAASLLLPAHSLFSAFSTLSPHFESLPSPRRAAGALLQGGRRRRWRNRRACGNSWKDWRTSWRARGRGVGSLYRGGVAQGSRYSSACCGYGAGCLPGYNVAAGLSANLAFLAATSASLASGCWRVCGVVCSALATFPSAGGFMLAGLPCIFCLRPLMPSTGLLSPHMLYRHMCGTILRCADACVAGAANLHRLQPALALLSLIHLSAACAARLAAGRRMRADGPLPASFAYLACLLPALSLIPTCLYLARGASSDGLEGDRTRWGAARGRRGTAAFAAASCFLVNAVAYVISSGAVRCAWLPRFTACHLLQRPAAPFLPCNPPRLRAFPRRHGGKAGLARAARCCGASPCRLLLPATVGHFCAMPFLAADIGGRRWEGVLFYHRRRGAENSAPHLTPAAPGFMQRRACGPMARWQGRRRRRHAIYNIRAWRKRQQLRTPPLRWRTARGGAAVAWFASGAYLRDAGGRTRVTTLEGGAKASGEPTARPSSRLPPTHLRRAREGCRRGAAARARAWLHAC